MAKFYQDYYWKGGVPFGFLGSQAGYKIVADPYRKWITIEQGVKIVYDSRLIDFRKLHPSEQTGWEKTVLSETEEQAVSAIRNQDDRLVYLETAYFKKQRCHECHIHSPHGFLLSIHQMCYREEGAPFDGVVLYDANHHPVMIKKYLIDNRTGEFGELIEEIWDFENIKIVFNMNRDYNALSK